MSRHDQVGDPLRAESVEPFIEEGVHGGLADPDRRVGHQVVDAEVRRDVLGCEDLDASAERRGVGSAQLACPPVHVDRQDPAVGVAQRLDTGDRARAAAEVDHHVRGSGALVGAVGVRRRQLAEQQRGARVDPVGGEHAAVGRELDGSIRQLEADRRRAGSHARVGAEVVGGGRGRRVRSAGRARHELHGIVGPMASPYAIRVVGDPVLRQRAEEVADIDERLVRLSEDMLTTMYDAPGLGLAAPQVGVQKRFFVYDLGAGDGGQVLINPVVTESDGEWEYLEGCLSVPGMAFEIVRPARVHVTGIDLDGNEVSFEADELFSRLIQHELDHLDGVLLLEHLDDDQRREAKRELRERVMASAPPVSDEAPKRSFFRLG